MVETNFNMMNETYQDPFFVVDSGLNQILIFHLCECYTHICIWNVPQGIDPTIADASTDKITSSVVRQLSSHYLEHGERVYIKPPVLVL